MIINIRNKAERTILSACFQELADLLESTGENDLLDATLMLQLLAILHDSGVSEKKRDRARVMFFTLTPL